MLGLIVTTGFLSFAAIIWAMLSSSKRRDLRHIEQDKVVYLDCRKWSNRKVGQK